MKPNFSQPLPPRWFARAAFLLATALGVLAGGLRAQNFEGKNISTVDKADAAKSRDHLKQSMSPQQPAGPAPAFPLEPAFELVAEERGMDTAKRRSVPQRSGLTWWPSPPDH